MSGKSFSIKSILAPLLSLLLVIAGAFVLLLPSGKSTSNTAGLQAGISYINAQEEKDVSSVDREIRMRTSMEALEGMSVWEKLNYFDTYIIGDSRTAVFSWSGIIPEHVWAENSTTIKFVGEKIDLIASARPGNLVLSFGMNDLGMYEFYPDDYWETAQDYIEACKYYVDMIREVSPDTNVYINCIIPALPVGIELQPRWALVPEWNAALEEFCAGYDVGYIDVAFITDKYGDYFEDDGVHFYIQSALDEWGAAILEAVEEKEFAS